jgi:hypothetical protein
MKTEKLAKLYNEGFPWVAVNENNSKDYRTFLCLASAIREMEHLEENGEKYKLIPTDNLNKKK